jgi:hypothetical protein
VFTIADGGATTIAPVDAATATVTNVARFAHALTTANAATDGIGAGIDFQSADSTSAIGATVALAAINAYMPAATHASRTGAVDFNVTDNAATRTVLSIGANGSARTFAAFGATRVIQPATTGTATGFTAGAGTTVTHLSTFTGNTGSAAYTIGDVVLALKQLGWLAA